MEVDILSEHDIPTITAAPMPNPTRTRNPMPERSPQPGTGSAANPAFAPPGGGQPDPSAILLRDFAQRFLLLRRHDVQRAGEWLEARSFPDLVQLGSQIRGSGPTFGFPEVGPAGAHLEAAARAGDPDGVASALDTLRRLLGTR